MSTLKITTCSSSSARSSHQCGWLGGWKTSWSRNNWSLVYSCSFKKNIYSGLIVLFGHLASFPFPAWVSLNSLVLVMMVRGGDVLGQRVKMSLNHRACWPVVNITRSSRSVRLTMWMLCKGERWWVRVSAGVCVWYLAKLCQKGKGCMRTHTHAQTYHTKI